MNDTRDIVKDLLPLVIAGEASADSCAAVEELVRADPELTALQRALAAEQPGGAPFAMVADHERVALERARTLLRRRSWQFGLALFFTALPLSCAGDSVGLTFLLIRDRPMLGSVVFAVAASLWIAWAATARRVRVTGL
jgi:hypothetical protein